MEDIEIRMLAEDQDQEIRKKSIIITIAFKKIKHIKHIEHNGDHNHHDNKDNPHNRDNPNNPKDNLDHPIFVMLEEIVAINMHFKVTISNNNNIPMNNNNIPMNNKFIVQKDYIEQVSHISPKIK